MIRLRDTAQNKREMCGISLFRRQACRQVLLPAVPALLVSLPANIANTFIPGADYMFFRLESFFFAPIGQVLPKPVTALMVYAAYAVIHCVPYLPSYLTNRKKEIQT